MPAKVGNVWQTICIAIAHCFSYFSNDTLACPVDTLCDKYLTAKVPQRVAGHRVDKRSISDTVKLVEDESGQIGMLRILNGEQPTNPHTEGEPVPDEMVEVAPV
jgi:hypothetical protein